MADVKDHPVAQRLAARRAAAAAAANKQEEENISVNVEKVEAHGPNSTAVAAAIVGKKGPGKVSVKCKLVKAVSSPGGEAKAFAYLGNMQKNVKVEVEELVADSTGRKKQEEEAVPKEPTAQQQQPSAPQATKRPAVKN